MVLLCNVHDSSLVRARRLGLPRSRGASRPERSSLRARPAAALLTGCPSHSPPRARPGRPHLPIATQAGGGGPRPDGSRDPDDVHMHICTGDEPLRGGLVASGLLFGAQHMQALPSYHPLPSGLPLCMCMCMCMCMCTCICICICICMCVCASVSVPCRWGCCCRLGDGLRLGCALRGIRQSVLLVPNILIHALCGTRACSSAPTSGCR